MAKKRMRRPQPLAPPPQSSTLRSRKRARVATTLFHKYTQQRDAAVARAREGGCKIGDDDNILRKQVRVGNRAQQQEPRKTVLLDEVKKWDGKISEMGGREEYQKASQLNTHLFSTSKCKIPEFASLYYYIRSSLSSCNTKGYWAYWEGGDGWMG